MCEMANDMKHESGRCKFENTDVVCQRSGQEAMIMERDSVCEFWKTWKQRMLSEQKLGQNTAKLIWLIFRGKRGRARKGKSSWSSARCPVRVSWSFHIFRFAFLSNVLLQPLQLATNTKTGGLVQLTTCLTTVTPTNKNSTPLLLSTYRRSRKALRNKIIWSLQLHDNNLLSHICSSLEPENDICLKNQRPGEIGKVHLLSVFVTSLVFWTSIWKDLTNQKREGAKLKSCLTYLTSALIIWHLIVQSWMENPQIYYLEEVKILFFFFLSLRAFATMELIMGGHTVWELPFNGAAA